MLPYLYTYIILVEHSKHQRGKFTGIALRKELFVDFNKTLRYVHMYIYTCICVGVFVVVVFVVIIHAHL